MDKQNGNTKVFDPSPLNRGLKRRGISADDLAIELDKDERTVYKALAGKAVNLLILAEICRALDVAGIRFLE
jgi:DNA-binding Xre family transcriptional regulator